MYLAGFVEVGCLIQLVEMTSSTEQPAPLSQESNSSCMEDLVHHGRQVYKALL